MPYPMKLSKQAEERGISERALVIDAIETTRSLRQAAEKLGVTEGAIRAAMIRHEITVERRGIVRPTPPPRL